MIVSGPDPMSTTASLSSSLTTNRASGARDILMMDERMCSPESRYLVEPVGELGVVVVPWEEGKAVRSGKPQLIPDKALLINNIPYTAANPALVSLGSSFPPPFTPGASKSQNATPSSGRFVI